jgi:hypothetical protein
MKFGTSERVKMTRKTGKALLKARQQMRAARIARTMRELAAAGVSLKLEKPSPEALREKEKELKELYFEMFPEEAGKQPIGGEPAPPEAPTDIKERPAEEEKPEERKLIAAEEQAEVRLPVGEKPSEEEIPVEVRMSAEDQASAEERSVKKEEAPTEGKQESPTLKEESNSNS